VCYLNSPWFCRRIPATAIESRVAATRELMLCDSRRATFADCCARGRMVGIVQFKWNYPAEARTPLQYRLTSPPQQECPSRQTNGRCVRRPSLFRGCPYKSVGILITPPRAPLPHAYVCQGCSPRPMLPSLRSSPAACVHLRTTQPSAATPRPPARPRRPPLTPSSTPSLYRPSPSHRRPRHPPPAPPSPSSSPRPLPLAPSVVPAAPLPSLPPSPLSLYPNREPVLSPLSSRSARGRNASL
jgi:hypothetical protein